MRRRTGASQAGAKSRDLAIADPVLVSRLHFEEAEPCLQQRTQIQLKAKCLNQLLQKLLRLIMRLQIPAQSHIPTNSLCNSINPRRQPP
jgi:hypothetical protein